MIQRYLKDELAKVLPDLEWTADFYTGTDNTGSVYSERGGQPDIYEAEMQYPTYMVYIRSSDWYYAEYAARKVFEELHRKSNFDVTVEYKKDGVVVAKKSYHVFFISAASEPNRIGVKDNIMDYSINFDVTLTEKKEETTNAT